MSNFSSGAGVKRYRTVQWVYIYCILFVSYIAWACLQGLRRETVLVFWCVEVDDHSCVQRWSTIPTICMVVKLANHLATPPQIGTNQTRGDSSTRVHKDQLELDGQSPSSLCNYSWTHPPPRYRQHDHIRTCSLYMYFGSAMPGRRAWVRRAASPKKAAKGSYVSNDDNLWLCPITLLCTISCEQSATCCWKAQTEKSQISVQYLLKKKYAIHDIWSDFLKDFFYWCSYILP